MFLFCSDTFPQCFFFFSVVGGILSSALALEEETRLRRQCQSLLTVAKNLFSHLGMVLLHLHILLTQVA